LDVLSPTFLMVLGLLALSGCCGQKPVWDLVRGGVLAVFLAWLPQLLLPSESARRRTRSRARSGRQVWPRTLATVLVLVLGLVMGLLLRVPQPVLILAVTMWTAVLVSAVISLRWPVCRQAAIAGVVSAALTVRMWPLGASALVLVVLIGVTSVRSGRRRWTGVAAAAGLGLFLGAVPIPLWG
jgi:hypothetical protein